MLLLLIYPSLGGCAQQSCCSTHLPSSAANAQQHKCCSWPERPVLLSHQIFWEVILASVEFSAPWGVVFIDVQGAHSVCVNYSSEMKNSSNCSRLWGGKWRLISKWSLISFNSSKSVPPLSETHPTDSIALFIKYFSFHPQSTPKWLKNGFLFLSIAYSN